MRILYGSALYLMALSASATTVYTNGNFTLLDANGNIFGGTNDVSWVYDETSLNTTVDGTVFNGVFQSSRNFFGSPWTVHDVRIFGEGSYTFDTTCSAIQIQSGISDCNNPLQAGQTEQYINMDVGAGQLGAHLLFDYTVSNDSDIVLVWDKNTSWVDSDGVVNGRDELYLGPIGAFPDPTMDWQLLSSDANGDGIHGTPFVDGSFPGFYANFSFNQTSAVPVPAAVWLFGSGLIMLSGLARRRSS